MFKFPKISCVTVTTGRYDLLKKSVYCFLQQTYKNKELVIVSQGDTESNLKIEEYLDGLNVENIVFVKAPQRLSLGAMRNLSIEIATGDIICQWDDDDLYYPTRLMSQYHALLGGNVVASLYTQHLKLFTDTGKVYWCDWSDEHPQWRTMLCGTIMFHKELFYQFNNRLYPEKGDQSDREEDMNVLIKFSRIGKLMPVKEGHHYIYVFHGNNTYDCDHHKLALNKRILDKNQLLQRESLLKKTFDSVGVDQPLEVCSLDEVVFTYDAKIGKEQ